MRLTPYSAALVGALVPAAIVSPDGRATLSGNQPVSATIGSSPVAGARDGSGPGETAPPDHFTLLHDNGMPDGVNGYSNLQRGIFGPGRRLLDDFEIVDGPWLIDGLRHRGIWGSLPPGSGHGMQICFRADDAGAPGPEIATAHGLLYQEDPTGNIFFSREEYVAFVTFEPVILPAGRYWFEANTSGPQSAYWLTTGHGVLRGSECWVNYDDFDGLVSGTDQFGIASELNWELWGSRCAGEPECCPADLDASGAVDFGDILAVIAAWGPCGSDCPEDLDFNTIVALPDLLLVLSAWGACP